MLLNPTHVSIVVRAAKLVIPRIAQTALISTISRTTKIVYHVRIIA